MTPTMPASVLGVLVGLALIGVVFACLSVFSGDD